MQIIEVVTKRQLKKFVGFPDKLYASCPQYVPALHSDQLHTLTADAALEYCTNKLWLALDDKGEVTGRISAFVNPRYNERYGKKCCRFGWFDVIEDFEVAKALIDTATAWAKQQGMNQIHGPLFYNTLGKQGMLVEGFENIPQANTLYNYPYYQRFIEKLGFEKECDWVQYIIEGWEVPERIKLISQRIMERNKLHYENVQTLAKDPAKVHSFLQLYSDIFAENVYNFIPFTEAEMAQEASQVMSMLKDNYCSIVMDSEDNVAGFAINFPSMSKAMQKARGSMLPFGWFHLLKALSGKNDTADLMLIGTAPQWRSKGVSSLFHCDISAKWAAMDIKYSITNPQIETNNAVNVWESYPKQPFMRRRCYIKNID